MLKLKKPMTFGTRTYDVLVAARGLWHWSSRVIEADFIPAQEEEQHIRLGTETLQGDGKRVTNAPIVANAKFPDSLNGDPAFALIMQKFQEAQELFEQYVVATGLLNSIVFESGEDSYPLECEYIPSGKPYKMQRMGVNGKEQEHKQGEMKHISLDGEKNK